MSEEIDSSATLANRDGEPLTDAQKDKADLIDRLFKAFTKRLPEESLSTRSNLAVVAYEEFIMWATGVTREEYNQAEVILDDGPPTR